MVVFTADNGGSLPHAQNNEPWRGGKQDHYDGGLRVPFMMRWPAQVRPGSRSDYAGLNFDLFPTFLESAGANPAADLDAISLVPVPNGGTIIAPRELYFVRREGGTLYGGKTYKAIIRNDRKLMQNDPFSPPELYNLKTDPQERTNLAATNQTICNELSAALRRHIQCGGAMRGQNFTILLSSSGGGALRIDNTGGGLELQMSNTPNRSLGTAPESLPPSSALTEPETLISK